MKCLEAAQRLSLPFGPLILQATTNKDCSWRNLLSLIMSVPNQGTGAQRVIESTCSDITIQHLSTSEPGSPSANDATVAERDATSPLFGSPCNLSSLFLPAITSLPDFTESPLDTSSASGPLSRFNTCPETSVHDAVTSSHAMRNSMPGVPTNQYTDPPGTTRSLSEGYPAIQEPLASDIDSNDALSYLGGVKMTRGRPQLDQHFAAESWASSCSESAPQVGPNPTQGFFSHLDCSSTTAPPLTTSLAALEFLATDCGSSVNSLKRKEREEQLPEPNISALDANGSIAMPSPMWQDLRNIWRNSLIPLNDHRSDRCSTHCASPFEHASTAHITTPDSPVWQSAQTPTSPGTLSISRSSSLSLLNPSATSTTFSSFSCPSSSWQSNGNAHPSSCDSSLLYNSAREVFRHFPVLSPLEVLARREFRRYRTLPDHLISTILAAGRSRTPGPVEDCLDCDGQTKTDTWEPCYELVVRLHRQVQSGEAGTLNGSMVDKAVTLCLFSRSYPFGQDEESNRFRESMALGAQKLCDRLGASADSGTSLLTRAELRTVKLLRIEMAASELVKILHPRMWLIEPANLTAKIVQVEASYMQEASFAEADFLVTEGEGDAEPFRLHQEFCDAQFDPINLAKNASSRLNLLRLAVEASRTLFQTRLQASLTSQAAEQESNSLQSIHHILSKCSGRMQSLEPDCQGSDSNAVLYSLVNRLVSLANATLETQRVQARRASCEAQLVQELLCFTSASTTSTHFC